MSDRPLTPAQQRELNRITSWEGGRTLWQCYQDASDAAGGEQVGIHIVRGQYNRFACTIILQVRPFTEVSMAHDTPEEAFELALEYFRTRVNAHD
jgi:hypothetical protein